MYHAITCGGAGFVAIPAGPNYICTGWYEITQHVTDGVQDMASDPFGFMARMSSASLLAITPEYWKVRAARSPGAATLQSDRDTLAIQTSRVTIDGLEIRLARAPKADAPTVLFLSPLPQSLHCYEQTWTHLTGEADLVAVDLPGFGGSEGGMDQMTFAAQSAFLEKIVSHLDLSDVHIVAPDVAMPVALHYVMHRAHAASSILIGDGPGVLPSADGSLIRKIVGSAFWRAMVRINGARTFLATASQIGYLHYRMGAAELQDYVSAYEGRVDQVVAYFASYPEGLKTIDSHIDTLELPVQVFWGDQDAFLGSENARLLHKRLPHSRLTIFEDCGHFCYQDKPEAFTAMVQEWINGGYRTA